MLAVFVILWSTRSTLNEKYKEKVRGIVYDWYKTDSPDSELYFPTVDGIYDQDGNLLNVNR